MILTIYLSVSLEVLVKASTVKAVDTFVSASVIKTEATSGMTLSNDHSSCCTVGI